MAKKLNPDCPCTSSCARHGDCEACRANHAGGLTSCQRLEKQEKKEN
ncbi:hypothetical protein LJC74_00640 [Eubacteriales bacterium OttesenSCG-928-A19]|nr:hypothetical protein [Eubacteriales bacterium OttesenSCG-928-A19]